MWFYVQRVLIPYQEADAALHQQPRGILSDLYPRWIGARELLRHGVNPYGADITRQIQQGYYGRELDPRRPEDPKDEQRFVYPLYVVILLAPTVTLPFSLVRAGFTVFLILLTAASVLLWMRALRWRTSWAVIAVWLLLTMGSFPVAQGIKLQQLSLLVAGLLSACAAAVASGFLITGGILLALATIKPQLACLPVAWMMLWVLRDCRHRQRLAWAFLATMIFLLAVSQWLVPGWIGDFLDGLHAYHQYTQDVSVLGWLLTPAIGNLVEAVLVVVTVWIGWPLLAKSADVSYLGISFALIVSTSVLVVPMFAPYNQVLLLPAIMVIGRHTREFWRGGGTNRLLLLLAGGTLAWQWVASLGLMGAALILPATIMESGWKIPLYMMFVIPIFTFAAMAMWTRRTAKESKAQS